MGIKKFTENTKEVRVYNTEWDDVGNPQLKVSTQLRSTFSTSLRLSPSR